MPGVRAKTHRGAAKRFRLTRNKKVIRRRANLNHILGKKSSRRKRRLAQAGAQVSPEDTQRVRRLLRA